jgi:hypothetical protein
MLQAERNGTPTQGNAMVTFLRPMDTGGEVAFDLWDGARFMGKLTKKTLLEQEVEAGEHYFMAKAANWSVMKADLKPGERYYVVARPAVSSTEIAVVLAPATLDSEASDLTRWLSRLTPITAAPEKALRYELYHANEARSIRRKAKAGEIFVRVLE